ncbi:MAG: transposase, family, partial [Gemmatimonadetes bacterium]|nr:transposase, family [Gemmatimonadota bacterium]
MQRKRFTRAQRRELWARWQAGDTFETIAQALAISSPGVSRVITAAGGIRPRPSTRRPGALSLAEREIIERGLAADHSYRAIARMLGRAPTTISREIARHG